jgi:hypothetical protein
MKVTFIGNCQLVALCYYFQQLVDDAKWVCYGPEFLSFLDPWSDKCVDKILDHEGAVERVRTSDVIVYQEVVEWKSTFCNERTLRELKSSSCILIKVPSIQWDYSDADILKGLQARETANRVDITASDMFERFKDTKLMLDICHPTTFMFLELVREICKRTGLKFFTDEQVARFLENENHMGLPA